MKYVVECQHYGCNRSCKKQNIELGDEELQNRKALAGLQEEGKEQIILKCPIMSSRLFNIVGVEMDKEEVANRSFTKEEIVEGKNLRTEKKKGRPKGAKNKGGKNEVR